MRRAVGFVAICLSLLASSVPAQQLRIALEDINGPQFAAHHVSILFSGDMAEAEIGELRLAGRQWHQLHLTCAQALIRAGAYECGGGSLQLGKGATLPLNLRYQANTGMLDVHIERAPLAALTKLLPELAAWKAIGTIDADLRLSSQSLSGKIVLSDLSFSDADGNHAGEQVAADLEFSALPAQPRGWYWDAQWHWTAGGVYLQPVYLKGVGQSMTARGRLDADFFSIDEARAEFGSLGKAVFSLNWNTAEKAPTRLSMNATEIDLAQAGVTLLQPWLDQSALPKVKLGGRAGIALEYTEGMMSKLDIDLVDADIVEENGSGFSLTGIQAHVPWRRDGATQAQFKVTGASFGRLPLGPFALPLRMDGFRFDLPATEIPLLDGKLNLEDLHIHRQGGTWHWQLAASLEPVSMPRLTERLGLPHMNGLLSASIPKVSYADHTLTLDGALVISVFDGYLSATGLRLVDPLGPAPRLEADMEMRHLDLGMLTETFSFGDITGYLDGDVEALELVGWRPQHFRARLYSSPGNYRKRISQRAVQDISSLGGAGAAAAIERTFLGVFQTFGYDRLGLSCVLNNGVCSMGGIEAAPQGYVIVKGGGIPALSVIGYNRQVQWDELLNRLAAVIQGRTRAVIH